VASAQELATRHIAQREHVTTFNNTQFNGDTNIGTWLSNLEFGEYEPRFKEKGIRTLADIELFYHKKVTCMKKWVLRQLEKYIPSTWTIFPALVQKGPILGEFPRPSLLGHAYLWPCLEKSQKRLTNFIETIGIGRFLHFPVSKCTKFLQEPIFCHRGGSSGSSFQERIAQISVFYTSVICP
jgi:hypothetical protein